MAVFRRTPKPKPKDDDELSVEEQIAEARREGFADGFAAGALAGRAEAVKSVEAMCRRYQSSVPRHVLLLYLETISADE